MLTETELKTMAESPSAEQVPALIAEIERMRQFLKDYGASVEKRLDEIDAYRQALVEENERLLTVREGALVERDACVGLMLKIAAKSGLKAGVTPDLKQAAVELPAGQVAWEIEPSEAHLFEGLPEYADSIAEREIVEKYRIVMNPGV